MSTAKLKAGPIASLLDDLYPVLPYTGQWLLNFCVDIGVSVIHPISQLVRAQPTPSLKRLTITWLTTLVRYPAQWLLTVSSLILNALASLINNVCLSNSERALSAEERDYLEPIFGRSVNFDDVRLQFGGVKEKLRISPQAVANDIFIREFWGGRAVYPDGTLTHAGLRLLGHEIAHVWQYQHTGAGYIGDSLVTQALDIIGRKLGTRLSDGYDLYSALKQYRSIDECNVEQQAVMAELIGMTCSEDKDDELKLATFNQVSEFDLNDDEFDIVTQAHRWFGQVQ